MPALDGHRKFVWFTPKGRNPTQYEMFTVGQQSGPARWLAVDWPLRFDDGRAPFTEDSTALRCSDWEAYRDPAQLWQRPYVVAANREEQALDRLVPAMLGDALVADMGKAWLHDALGRYLAAWPFVEYGLFLAGCYAVREALADTIEFALAFEAGDRLRHVQDIVHLLFALEEAEPSFTDEAARRAWMEDPALVPTREFVEHLVSSRDWAEIAVVTDLVFEPLVGDLVRTEFFARNAAHNGDAVTPLVLAGARTDARRQREAVAELVRLVLADPEHGPANRRVLEGWLGRWTPAARSAAEALRAMFALDGIAVDAFEPSLARVTRHQAAVLAELGLTVAEGSTR